MIKSHFYSKGVNDYIEYKFMKIILKILQIKLFYLRKVYPKYIQFNIATNKNYVIFLTLCGLLQNFEL